MTSTCPDSRAEAFRKAVETDDFSSAEAALQNYLTWFRSAPRGLAEAAQAKSLFEWGAEVALSRKARLAGELNRLTKVFTGYRPPRACHTWHVDG